MFKRRKSRKAARIDSAAHSGIADSFYRRTLRCEPLEQRWMLAVVTVTTVSDTTDLSDGLISLREAVFAANTISGADTIEFAPSLTAGGPATVPLTHGEMKVTDALTISGPAKTCSKSTRPAATPRPIISMAMELAFSMLITDRPM